MAVNKRSLKNLNPGIKVRWNNKDFKSIAALSRDCGVPPSTVQDYLRQDKPLFNEYIDEVI